MTACGTKRRMGCNAPPTKQQLRQKAEREAAKEAKEKETKRQKQKKAYLKMRPRIPVFDGSTFPFLELPTEIRNMIYHHLLVDTSFAIRFQATTSSRDGRSTVSRLSRARPNGPDRDDIPGQTKGSITLPAHSYKPSISNFNLAVHIFLLNRQINAEASPIFYGANLFNFEGVSDLYAFLCHCQHRLPLLTKLGLASVASNNKTFRGALHVKGMPLHSVFPLLAGAVNIEALYLHAPVWQSFGGRADIAARAFFQHAHVWMHACALAKGSKLAVLEVVKLPEASSERSEYGKWQVEKAGHAVFRSELAGRLTAS